MAGVHDEENSAAVTLQNFARRKYHFQPPDLREIVRSQALLRTEVEQLVVRLSQYAEKAAQEQEQATTDLLQLKEQDAELKTRHRAVVDEVQRLRTEHGALAEASHTLNAEHNQIKGELNKIKDELTQTREDLAAALDRKPSAEADVQTDPIEPQIMMVEQPPSQETLAEIAEQLRKEFANQSEEFRNMKSRNEYLERKEASYARMKEELDHAQALLTNIGSKTASMSSDLVKAREASRV
jgi:uncharacterized phage infection (PIP) family protein YhgE